MQPKSHSATPAPHSPSSMPTLSFLVSALPAVFVAFISLSDLRYDKNIYPSAEDVKPFVLPVAVLLCGVVGVAGMLLTKHWLSLLNKPERMRAKIWRLRLCRITSVLASVIVIAVYNELHDSVWLVVSVALTAASVALAWSCPTAAPWAYAAFLSFGIVAMYLFIVSFVWILGDDWIGLILMLSVVYPATFLFGYIFMRTIIHKRRKVLHAAENPEEKSLP